MSERELRFDVEQAGCESCAALVRTALEPMMRVAQVSVDETADVATVIGHGDESVTVAALDEALADVSEGSGHRYRVVPGSLT